MLACAVMLVAFGAGASALPRTNPAERLRHLAIDWRLDAGRPREKREADALIKLLLATDSRGNRHALARRMGIQEIIFNCRAWYPGPRMVPYGPCSRPGVSRTTAHRDHIHIGMNWRGAMRQTTFWAPR